MGFFSSISRKKDVKSELKAERAFNIFTSAACGDRASVKACAPFFKKLNAETAISENQKDCIEAHLRAGCVKNALQLADLHGVNMRPYLPK